MKVNVGAIIVTSGCSGGNRYSVLVTKARHLLAKIGEELGVSVAIREIGGPQAMQGGLSSSLAAEARGTYARVGEQVLPSIAINGKWVSVGSPDEGVLRKALLEASGARAPSRREVPNE